MNLSNKDMYINKLTFEVVEDIIPKGIDWLKIPKEAEAISSDLVMFKWNGKTYDEYYSAYVFGVDEAPINCWVKGTITDLHLMQNIVWSKTAHNVDDKSDVVNHPTHYTSDDCGVEAIQITSLLPACISNAVKYVWRCGKKDEDLQELKKALWYINYSIDNDLPSFINELSDSLEFESLIDQVKSSWTGNKYMFIDAVYWGNQETMKRAIQNLIAGYADKD